MSHSKLLINILVISLILVYVYLITGYFRQRQAQEVLINRIGDTQQALELQPVPAADLEERLQKARLADYAVKQSISGQDINIDKILDQVLQTADKLNLKINPVTTEKWTEKNIGAGVYLMLPIDLTISGNRENFVNFLSYLEDKEKLPGLFVKDVSIIPDTGTGLIEVDTGSVSGISATVIVMIVKRLQPGD